MGMFQTFAIATVAVAIIRFGATEPASLLLLGTGLLVAGARVRRRPRNQ